MRGVGLRDGDVRYAAACARQEFWGQDLPCKGLEKLQPGI